MSSELDKRMEPVAGYLALGLYQEAWDELDSLPVDLRVHDDVLATRIGILQHLEKWENARILSESLAKRNPEKVSWWLDWAYSLRREQSVHEARKVLLEAAAHHPDEATIPYNLGCYACVLGEMEAARKLLEMAFTMDESLRREALDDPDLDPIFGENLFESAPTFVPPHLPESDSP